MRSRERKGTPICFRARRSSGTVLLLIRGGIRDAVRVTVRVPVAAREPVGKGRRRGRYRWQVSRARVWATVFGVRVSVVSVVISASSPS